MWSLIPWRKDGGGTMTAADPFEREFSRIRRDFDSLVSRMWSDWPSLVEGFGRFDMDVEETDTHYVTRVTAPGFDVSDFDVQVSGNQLIIKAEHKEEHSENGGSGYRFGRLHRSVTLPQGAETDAIEATYRAGILELKIPKGKEAQGKRIEVKAA